MWLASANHNQFVRSDATLHHTVVNQELTIDIKRKLYFMMGLPLTISLSDTQSQDTLIQFIIKVAINN